MKKLLLLLLFIPLTSFGQVSEQKIKFDNYKVGNSSMKISFGGQYSDDVWKFKEGDQIIYFTPDDLAKAVEAFESAFKKAVEWDKVANENNVDKLVKVMPFTFNTTEGMLYDSGYESVGSKKAKFKFERFVSSTKETFSYVSTSIWQNGEYNVRSAYFQFPSINVRDKESVDKFQEFLNFMKSNKSIIEEKISSSKTDLFK